MNKYLFEAKRNTLFLITIIVTIVVLSFDLFIVLFDLIQLLVVKSNSANLATGFLACNIFAGVVNMCYIIYIVIAIILRKK